MEKSELRIALESWLNDLDGAEMRKLEAILTNNSDFPPIDWSEIPESFTEFDLLLVPKIGYICSVKTFKLMSIKRPKPKWQPQNGEVVGIYLHDEDYPVIRKYDALRPWTIAYSIKIESHLDALKTVAELKAEGREWV